MGSYDGAPRGRVLIASSCDWLTVARLPATLARAGISTDLIDRGHSHVSRSAHLRRRIVACDGPASVAAGLLDIAGEYDRVIVCDEALLSELLASGDRRANAILPAPPALLGALLDKTSFPDAARAAGLTVADSRVVAHRDELDSALRDVGLPAVLKGRSGNGGRSVRSVEDRMQARSAADELGYPLLVERRVDGVLALMPCLFHEGRLVAAFAAEKWRTLRRHGPSSVDVFLEVDEHLRAMAEAAGAAFELEGFVSFDFFREPGVTVPTVIEINPRPVAQLHLGKLRGADLAGAFAEVLAGRSEGEPSLARGGGSVAVFPRELQRLTRRHGRIGGTLRWVARPGALGDVPWDDPAVGWSLLRETYRRAPSRD